jgi:hypothetical protein
MAGVPTGREETVACTNRKMFDTQHQQGPRKQDCWKTTGDVSYAEQARPGIEERNPQTLD